MSGTAVFLPWNNFVTSHKTKLARAPLHVQLSLFDMEPNFPIQSNAHARNAYGTAAQSIVCAALKLRAISIDGSCETCFDAERDNNFYEIKSVHRNGKIVVYDWRAAKELAAGVPVFYAILVHSVRGARTSDAMFKQFRKSNLEILLVPVHVLHHYAQQEPLRQIKDNTASPRAGYNRNGYKEGYRNVPLAPIRRQCVAATTFTHFRLYGVKMKCLVYKCDVTLPCLPPSKHVSIGQLMANPTSSPQNAPIVGAMSSPSPILPSGLTKVTTPSIASSTSRVST